MNDILLYAGGAMTAAWGISHLSATRGLVAGFGNISEDNRHIITMEWIVEGTFLAFLGALVMLTTAVNREASVATAVYIATAAGLIGLAVVSLFTGFKVHFLPFKMCPAIFSASATLVLLGAFI